MKKRSPVIDRLAGIEHYSTVFNGIGGNIKKNYNDFNVKEVINSEFLDNLTNDKVDKNIFPIYEMEKKGIDSNHAIMQIKKKFGTNLKIMGIKDAKATTLQYASADGNERLKDIKVGEISLKLIGYSKKPVEKSLLIGNNFKIAISDLKDNSKNNLTQFLSEINNMGNFYGLQRFGSERLVTHLVGKAILQKKFNEAIEILLTYTTKFDSKYSKEIREKLKDIKTIPNIVKIIPRGMDIEKKIAYEIIKGKDDISILRSVPISIRRLFVQAFQAYIYNRALSCAIENDDSLTECEKNDLCFEIHDKIIFGKIRKFENFDSNYEKIPIIRLPGYAYQPGKGRFDILVKKIMDEENISSKDFFIKEMQEISESGGYRQAALISKDFKFNTADNSTIVEFTLPKGSYATTLLREIIKPDDPIHAGF
ncbi:MAG TPA: tRNA pseudouridine(13) synthase TruD [Verrucomicrobiae bacterium]|nr:tRNA pseudouridine(13) synthase TruD [Verrucomicrobiae bacterium]